MNIDLNWTERDCIVLAIQQLNGKKYPEEKEILEKVLTKIIPTIKVVD